MVIPSTYIIVELFYLFAGHYAVLTAVMFLTLGYYALLLKGYAAWLKMGIGVILAFLMGMQGMRGILVIYGPLFCIEILRVFYLFWKKEWNRNAGRVTMWVLAMLAGSYVGSLLPFSIGQSTTSNFRKGFSKMFTEIIPDIGEVIGVTGHNTGVRICALVLSVTTVFMLLYSLLRICQRKEIAPVEWIYMFLWASPVMTALFVAFTTTENSERYYFVFVFTLAFSVILAIYHLQVKEKNSIIVMAAGGVLAIVLGGANYKELYQPVLENDRSQELDMEKVVACLEEQGIGYACATFENANTMTFLSNGRVLVAPVASVETMEICKWLSSTRWFPPNVPVDQKTAYIVTQADTEVFARFLEGKEEGIRKITEIGMYTVYVSDYNYANIPY